MTTVHMNGCSVSLHGHAEAKRNEQDHDLVCAAVSALTCTLAELVRRAYSAGALTEEPQVEVRPGSVCISCFPVDGETTLPAAFSFFRCGVEMLEETYPENIKLV